MSKKTTSRILLGVTGVLLIAGAVLLFRKGGGSKDVNEARLKPGMIDFANVGFAPAAITLAPGVHLLGKVVPGNAYAIETGDGLVLIDCGLQDDASFVIQQLKELNLNVDTLKKILITHIHADHCQGAAYLRERTGAMIYAGAGDAPLLEAGTDRDAFFSKYTMAGVKLHPTKVDVSLTGGESIELGDTTLTAVATPGHTPGSMCYRLDRDGVSILFTGDTVSSLTAELGTYITKLPPQFRGNATDYLTSFELIKKLPTPNMVLPGHTEDDPPGQSPWMEQVFWNRILDRGETELREVISHHAEDGRDFLGEQPFEILDGLFYLGRFRDKGMFGIVSGGQLVLFDAPGGRGFLEFINERLDQLGIRLPARRFVFLTSCDARNTANLDELVGGLGFKVVAPKEGLDALAKRCPENTEFISTDALPLSGMPQIVAHRLAGIGEFPVAYEIEIGGKTALVSGRFPVVSSESSINQLYRELSGPGGDASAFLVSLQRLGELSPDIWLPSTIVNDQNANIYGTQWRDVLRENRDFFRPLAESSAATPPEPVDQ